VPLAATLVLAAAVSATNDPYEFVLNPQLAQFASLGPIVATMIAGFVPLFIAWKVEGGNSARVSAAFGTDFVLLILAMAGYGVLSFRFDKREKEAL
jgi:hypothetical protein